jgi:hypothetical protein
LQKQFSAWTKWHDLPTNKWASCLPACTLYFTQITAAKVAWHFFFFEFYAMSQDNGMFTSERQTSTRRLHRTPLSTILSLPRTPPPPWPAVVRRKKNQQNGLCIIVLEIKNLARHSAAF